MSILVKLNVKDCNPLMHPSAAEKFNLLREIVKAGCGFDFLVICADIFRAANYTSSKDGVANRSWHKTGRAFDYDQNSKGLVIVSEEKGEKQFFRTYLRCAAQDGSQGKKLSVRDKRGHQVNGYLFDFTAAAESLGFKRIPAWSGWQKNYNRQEFWHYQFDEGLIWDAAMQQLKGVLVPAAQTKDLILGLNDRGSEVRRLQARLNELGYLPSKEIDGVFGAKTRLAVVVFQKAAGLSADGIAGANTRKALKLD
jgi:hypothetical protein